MSEMPPGRSSDNVGSAYMVKWVVIVSLIVLVLVIGSWLIVGAMDDPNNPMCTHASRCKDIPTMNVPRSRPTP
jgi:hypothetical protein